MIVFARGSITRLDALAPYIHDEMRAVDTLKATGVMTVVYRRAAGPGVYLLLEGSSLDAIRERVDALPFVVEGVKTPRVRGDLRDRDPAPPAGPHSICRRQITLMAHRHPERPHPQHPCGD